MALTMMLRKRKSRVSKIKHTLLLNWPTECVEFDAVELFIRSFVLVFVGFIQVSFLSNIFQYFYSVQLQMNMKQNLLSRIVLLF